MTRAGWHQLLRFRAQLTHLDEKLPAGFFAVACWGGLQDSIPRSGVLSLHARAEGTHPDSWEDPSVAQVWFRGSDCIVPRADAGIFTLGSAPRKPERLARLDRLADRIHRVTRGETLTVREVTERLGMAHPTNLREVTLTGRVHIRWNASQIWIIPVDRPEIATRRARFSSTARSAARGNASKRKVTVHSWSMLSPAVRDTIEAEALAFPIAGASKPSVASD